MSGFDRKPNRFESNWFDESHFYASKFISLDSVFRVIRGQDRQVQRKRHVLWNVLVRTLMESRPQIIVLDRCAQMTVISLTVPCLFHSTKNWYKVQCMQSYLFEKKTRDKNFDYYEGTIKFCKGV